MGEHRRSGVPPLDRTGQSHIGGLPPAKGGGNVAERRICNTPTEFGYFRPGEAVGNLAGNLPHWRQEGVTYFVTFRLADSLPQAKLQEWQRDRNAWLAGHPKPWDDDVTRQYHTRFTARIERWLDAGYGSCVLADRRVRSVVTDALLLFHAARYALDAWVVMPNHVHVVVTPLLDYGLSAILHTWKSFTSHAVGKRLPNWRGAFWQKEYFDHIVRGPDHLERFRVYISNNPSELAATDYSLWCGDKRGKKGLSRPYS